MHQATNDDMVWTSELRVDGLPFTREASWLATHWSKLEGFKRQALRKSLAAADPKLSVQILGDELVISGRPSAVLYLLRHSKVLDGIPRRSGASYGLLMSDDEFVDSMIGPTVGVWDLSIVLRCTLTEGLLPYCGPMVVIQPAKQSPPASVVAGPGSVFYGGKAAA
jgi:hypothetical protein